MAKKTINRSKLQYYRGDPNNKSKLKNGKPNPSYRGSGFYYNRTWNKAGFSKNYMSKYSNARDYYNKPNSRTISVRYKKVGGIKENAHQTDDYRKAGKFIEKNLNALNTPNTKTNLFGASEGKPKKSWYKGELESKFRKQEKKYKSQKTKSSKYVSKKKTSTKKKYN